MLERLRRLAPLLVLLAALAAGPAAAQVELIMVEQDGCVWCARWDREVSGACPNTAEGRTAPLRRVDPRGITADLDLASPPRLTPTFVLVRDGLELSRLEGYAGEDFFWGLLDRVLSDAGIEPPRGRHAPQRGRRAMSFEDGTDRTGGPETDQEMDKDAGRDPGQDERRNEGRDTDTLLTRAGLPVFDESLPEEELDRMTREACNAADFLKALSHEGRLMILCHLATGEKSVSALERLLSARQAAVSQQLSRLRLEGLVEARRDGKTIYYSLTDDRPRRIIELVYDMFCSAEGR